jgi:hypothetical protein
MMYEIPEEVAKERPGAEGAVCVPARRLATAGRAAGLVVVSGLGIIEITSSVVVACM